MATMQAAKTFWDLCGGQVSNLSLNKLLYIAHMFYLGEHGAPLASREFEAWDYGPVEPDLYHKLKAYGSEDVPDIFPVESYINDSNEFNVITKVAEAVGHARPGKLVSITHWDNGAWSRVYEPGIKGLVIPDKYILEEFNLRVERSGQKEEGSDTKRS